MVKIQGFNPLTDSWEFTTFFDSPLEWQTLTGARECLEWMRKEQPNMQFRIVALYDPKVVVE